MKFALAALVLCLFIPNPVLAVTTLLQDVPSTINEDSEFEATINISCSSTCTSYVRGVFFYPEDGTSYSGFTQNNNSEWIGSESDRTKYYKADNSFSGKIKFKFDPEKDAGTYFFKVGRYTSAGDTGADWSNAVSIAVIGPSPTPTILPTNTPVPEPTLAPTNTPIAINYSNTTISEYMAYPENGDEWIEIYNGNNFEVNLNGWYIDDTNDGGSDPKILSGSIPATSFKQFYLASAFLNNDGDDVRLLNGEKVEKDKTSFESSSKGKSWSKDTNGKWCQVDSTPNTSNPTCPTPTSVPTATSTSTSTPIPTPKPSSTPKPTSSPIPTSEVLGTTIEVTPEPSPTDSPTPTIQPKSNSLLSNSIAIISISAGVVLLSVAGWLGWKKFSCRGGQN